MNLLAAFQRALALLRAVCRDVAPRYHCLDVGVRLLNPDPGLFWSFPELLDTEALTGMGGSQTSGALLWVSTKPPASQQPPAFSGYGASSLQTTALTSPTRI